MAEMANPPLYDLIIAGAGPVGCVLAERAACELGWTCLIVEKRPHIGGNCYDFIHESGLMLHRYGPHFFRTTRKDLFDYLSAYTEWIPGHYRVQALYKGELFPLPVNLTTLEKFFRCPLTPETARTMLDRERVDISNPSNSEEFVLSRLGKKLYDAFYLGYTLKQWGVHPRELLPDVCGRLPIRFNRDNRYVDEPIQMMPRDGYTSMFERMLSHRLIRVLLNSDFLKLRHELKARKAFVYTGPVDAYFNFCYGALPWRSLDFEWIELNRRFYQPCVTINYPSESEFRYTRSVEIKHVTGQESRSTVISFEYPLNGGDPFYPVPTRPNLAQYSLYKDLADKETIGNGVYFCGRLATYRYLNIDQAMEEAFGLLEKLKERDAAGAGTGRCALT